MRNMIKLVFISFTLIIICESIVDRTYFTYLGLSISATSQDIQRAYEEKKIKIQGLEDEQQKAKKTKLLEQAYNTLNNQEKRNFYQMFTKDISKKQNCIQNAKKLSNKDSRKGKTFKLTLPVSVEDVYKGKTIKTTYLREVACDQCRGTAADSAKSLQSCPKCSGNGFWAQQQFNGWGKKVVLQATCPDCLGWGKRPTKICPKCRGQRIIKKLQQVQIQIPKGLPDGNILKIRNYGDQPKVGAPSDLQIQIIEIPTQKWARQGHNLILTVELSLQESIFGFVKYARHLNGKIVKLYRDEPTTKQTRMTFNEKGIYNKRIGKNGDLIVKYKILMPIFTDDQLDMWQEFFYKHKL